MNLLHRWYCRSDRWKHTLENDILPWSLHGVELGEDLLEIGPGPGLTTDWLRHRYRSITCLEIDSRLARSLQNRMFGTNVIVHNGSATAMPFRDQTFSAVVSFTMLHHMPSMESQDCVFRETFRVLRPGGMFAGTDSSSSLLMKIVHIGDTMVLVDPDRLMARLQSAGFHSVEVTRGSDRFRFSARRPTTHER